MTRMKRLGLFAAATLGAGLLPIGVLLFVVTPGIRGDLVGMLAKRYGQDVEIVELRWSGWPRPQLRGKGIVVGSGVADGPAPLARIGEFEIEADFTALLRRPRRIRRVHIQDMELHIRREGGQPQGQDGSERNDGSESEGTAAPPERRGSTSQAGRSQETGGGSASKIGESSSPVVVDAILADRVRLEIVSKDPEKDPLVFDIHDLRLTDVASDRPLSFVASLRNPKPPGEVRATGTFGPFDKSGPRRTPLSGQYTFAAADLGVFRGIGGTLDSSGSFDGTLGDIRARGDAQIRDFVVSPANQPVVLNTRFETIVGDTARDIDLRPVDVAFNDSRIVAVGEIARRPGSSGRTIELDVTARDSRIEDMLKFALAAEEPPLTGDIEFETRLVIPPGEHRVIEKLRLDGEFRIREGRFTDLDVQSTLAKLSHITGGDVEGDDGGSVVSDLAGRFSMDGGVLTFPELSFSVPGTRVELTGTIDLVGDELDLRGAVLTERRASEMAEGRAGALLRLLDPLLARDDAGAVVPITITGSRAKPSFGVDLDALTEDLVDWQRLLQRLRR